MGVSENGVYGIPSDILDHFSRENMMIDHDKPFDLGSLVGFP
jgi:hypothetical protein